MVCLGWGWGPAVPMKRTMMMMGVPLRGAARAAAGTDLGIGLEAGARRSLHRLVWGLPALHPRVLLHLHLHLQQMPTRMTKQWLAEEADAYLSLLNTASVPISASIERNATSLSPHVATASSAAPHC